MNIKVFIGIGLIILLAVVGIVAYILRPTPEASVPLEAIPVDVVTPEPEIQDESQPSDENQPVQDQEMAEPEPAATLQTESQAAGSNPSLGTVVFTIAQDQSEVRFTLGELLRGNPTTVIGITDQVAGEIAVDFENPANSRVGVILINARTFKTDNDFRNRAINNEILDTGTYEFITFTPTSISGFPENPQFGEAFTFQLTGDLTIRDTTRSVTFDMTVTAISETQLQGYGSTTVDRADFDLRIPNVPSVANVDEEVLLEIEFVALASQ